MKYLNVIVFTFQQRAQSNLTAKGALLFAALFLLFPVVIPAQSTVTTTTETASPSPSPTPEEKKSVVRGKVVYEDTGRPVRRASIYLFSSNAKNGPEMSGLTDNNGEFEIKNVPKGRYFVMVNSPGIITPLGLVEDPEIFDKQLEKEFFENAKKIFEEYSVDGSDTKIEVKARRGGAINGKVTYENGDPAVSVRVSILRKKGKNLSRLMTGLNDSLLSGVATDDRGVYRVAGLPPGEYLVSVAEPVSHNGKNSPQGGMDGMFEAMGFGAAGSLLVTYYPNANSSEEASTVNVVLGQEQNDINISIAERPLRKISGKVVMRSDKSPINNAVVRIKKNDNKIKGVISGMEINEIRTDENGIWSFQELPEGVYTVTVDSINETESKYNDKGEYEGSNIKRQLAGKKQEVTLSDSDISDIVLELSNGGSIEGKVILASGKPLSNSVYIKAETVADNKEDSENIYERRNENGSVESDGKFTINSLPAGPVTLSVGLYSEESGKYYVKSMTLNGLDLMTSAINMTEGGKVKNVQVVMGDDAATLKGKVVSADNKPAYGVGVVLISTNPSHWQRRNLNKNDYGITDAQGEFSVTTAPGEYFVVFLRTGEGIQNINPDWIRERTANAQRVLLNPNESKAVTLNAPRL